MEIGWNGRREGGGGVGWRGERGKGGTANHLRGFHLFAPEIVQRHVIESRAIESRGITRGAAPLSCMVSLNQTQNLEFQPLDLQPKTQTLTWQREQEEAPRIICVGGGQPGRARLGMTLEPLLWRHCSISGICLVEYIKEGGRGGTANHLPGFHFLAP